MSNITNIRNQINQHFTQKKEDYLKRRRENNRRKWGKYYHSKLWQNLREWKFLQNPCCEVCAVEGIVTPTDEIHHAKRFSSGITDDEKWRLFLNPNNLISLCSTDHDIAHRIMREQNKDYVSINEIIEYKKNMMLFT